MTMTRTGALCVAEAAIEETVRHLQAEEFARQLGGVLNQYAVT